MSPLLVCISMIVYFEARGEPYAGQVSVAQVATFRLEKKAPSRRDLLRNTNEGCKGLVRVTPTHSCSFSFYCDGIPEVVSNRRAWRRAKTIAKLVMNGTIKEERTIGATHYHNTSVHPYWADSLVRLGRIGNHIFYKEER